MNLITKPMIEKFEVMDNSHLKIVREGYFKRSIMILWNQKN